MQKNLGLESQLKRHQVHESIRFGIHDTEFELGLPRFSLEKIFVRLGKVRVKVSVLNWLLNALVFSVRNSQQEQLVA